MAHGVPHVVDYVPPFFDQSNRFDDPRQRFSKEVTKVLAPAAAYGRHVAPVCPVGPKSCSQCGTTRTPQWREGPEGPKTLCNACGVKRVRQMRTLLEGDRRRAAKSPANLQKQDSTDLPLSDDNYDPRDSSQKRPLRKAAARAAARVADSCSKPVWTGEEEDERLYQTASQDTGSGDSGGHNSDSAEEVAWVPERQAHPSHLPPSPMAAAVGPECAAAVNLLCMSVQQDAPQQGHAERPAEPVGQQRVASGNAARDSHKINAASFAQMANSALKWSSQLPAHAKAQEQVQEALRHLPGDKQAEMLLVKEELDAVARDAAAADAAVAAVAKILAIKQAASLKARATAAQAAKRVHGFMQGLDEEYGWSKQAQKRHCNQ